MHNSSLPRRFSEVAKIEGTHNLQIEVDIETILLSPGITYAAYLVFKFFHRFNDVSHLNESSEITSSQPTFVGLQYKFKDADESSFSHFADWTENGWMMIELCQFVSYGKVAKLELLLEGIPSYNIMLLEGIQFLPVEMQVVFKHHHHRS